jgi:hypothetical protein
MAILGISIVVASLPSNAWGAPQDDARCSLDPG